MNTLMAHAGLTGLIGGCASAHTSRLCEEMVITMHVCSMRLSFPSLFYDVRKSESLQAAGRVELYFVARKGYAELHVGQVGVGGLLRLSRTPW
jgi:hypothetical protein